MKAKIHPLLSAIAIAVTAGTAPVAADDKNKTYTDPAEADADYALQGEYSGTLGGEKAGAQVVALGDGKFDLVVYPGGLPGDGWDGDKGNRLKGSGATADGVTRFQLGDDSAAVLEKGKLSLLGKPAGELDHTVRESPTLGKKAPEGAVVLFDGSNLDAWKDGAKLGEDKLLQQGATSNQEFQDFSIHIEFRTPYQPHARGQGRGNSGFYAHGRYEVQILDSFGLEGEHNECGGVYSTKAPALNLCLPPLTWQTYDIDFTAARFDADGKKTADATMTVRHNGVLTHDKTVCDHATTAAPKPEGPEAGPVYFQDHGNPVRFRNLWVLPK